MLWIISGPSSAGKSHFLASPRARELTGLPPETKVWFPKDVGPGAPPAAEEAFVHYNLLRPAQLLDKAGRDVRSAFRYDADPQWLAIAALPQAKKAVIVTARRDMLLARVRGRALVEKGDPHAYGAAKWLRIYERVDLDAVYRLWREELARRGIPAVDVDGNGGE